MPDNAKSQVLSRLQQLLARPARKCDITFDHFLEGTEWKATLAFGELNSHAGAHKSFTGKKAVTKREAEQAASAEALAWLTEYMTQKQAEEEQQALHQSTEELLRENSALKRQNMLLKRENKKLRARAEAAERALRNAYGSDVLVAASQSKEVEELPEICDGVLGTRVSGPGAQKQREAYNERMDLLSERLQEARELYSIKYGESVDAAEPETKSEEQDGIEGTAVVGLGVEMQREKYNRRLDALIGRLSEVKDLYAEKFGASVDDEEQSEHSESQDVLPGEGSASVSNLANLQASPVTSTVQFLSIADDDDDLHDDEGTMALADETMNEEANLGERRDAMVGAAAFGTSPGVFLQEPARVERVDQ